jgi:L-fuconolactonase
MLSPAIDWAYRAVVDLDLALDALGFVRHIDNFCRLLDRHPAMRVVLDHALKPEIALGRFDEWAAGMSRLAAETPVLCKLSGLITEAGADWSIDSLRPYVAHVLGAFGAERVIWGSDWPVLANTASYRDWVTTAEALVAETFVEASDADRIFAGNAVGLYKLKLPDEPFAQAQIAIDIAG